ncbi:CBS domain-containing protein [Streptomyces sp. NBC_00006]|uniref:CBS domain-containing protein n=1 Tax=Streptomyces sp. NBC_00006 TaxID=2975619 RepID=UPI00224ED92A|nr:CBS domain-containing protein [Streptomyces sp. NBC_00006]MCX5529782.1 CBS domain-containing protein [Streptomyces sp. NBC_00006]
MRAWVVRAGRRGEREADALGQGLAIAGWQGVPDLSLCAGRGDVRRLVQRAYPDENNYTLRNWSGQLFRFWHEIVADDLMVLPRTNGQYAIGRVVGGYEYRPDAEDGMRHIRRVAWTTTDLRRDTFRPDLLQSLGSLLTVFELRRFDAARRIAEVWQGGSDPGRPDGDEPGAGFEGRRQLIDQARAHESGTGGPAKLTVRKLLELWGAERRSSASVASIRRDLEEAGLLCVPPFTEGTLDSIVTILVAGAEPAEDGSSQITRIARSAPVQADAHTEASPDDDGVDSAEISGVVQRVLGDSRAVGMGDILVGATSVEHEGALDDRADEGGADDDLASIAYLVGNLPSARVRPESVPVTATLKSAVTIMMLKQFSQLPVLDDHGRLLGVVSWLSIGQALLVGADARLADAVAPAPEVAASEHLLDCLPHIEKHGYVLVRDDAHRVCGIVTPADVAVEFRSRVSPFVLIEEVEQRLRRIVDERVPLDQIRACIAETNKKAAAKAEDASTLTLGKYPHLFGRPEAWEAAGLPVDQHHFTQALKRCARLRNDLMHFSPDPVGEDDIAFLNGLLDLLRKLDGQL